MRPDRVLGAVLAGGASSRFGSDKAAALLRGRTLLEHMRDLLAGVVGDVVVVGRDGGVPDLPAAGLGPLGGVAGALDHGARHGFASVLTIACDMPGAPYSTIEALLARAPSYCRDAPVLGHWPTALVGDLLERLTSARARPGDDERTRARSGGLSVRRWASDIGAMPIASLTLLPNINTRADLAAL